MQAAIHGEPDDPRENSDDSGYTHESDSSTSSSASSVFDFEQSYGRSYHAFRRGTYVLPNDELEQRRLNIHHRCMRLLLSNRHWLAPTRPLNVLDVGTGTGIWAVEVGDSSPSAHVIGIDISPIQPTLVPPNVEFQIMDAEEDWEGLDKRFDLVHTQFMNGVSIKKWKKFYDNAFMSLQPGGWVENHEVDVLFCCEGSDLPSTCAYVRWAELWNKGLQVLGATGRCCPEQMKAQMSDSGFTNIAVEIHRMPVGFCTGDTQYKELGLLNLEGITSGIGGMSLKAFLEGLNWSRNDMELLLMEVRKELQETESSIYIPIIIAMAQKPSM